jgi:hypothetical protein
MAHQIKFELGPVHSALVQKSVTAITNPAGQLSFWMLGQPAAIPQEGKCKKMVLRLLIEKVASG